MKRDFVIKELQELGARLAEEFGYENMKVGEDRQKVIWGEKLTEYLEKVDGECTKEIKWSDDKGGRVEFRFRFSTPCLSIQYYEDGKYQVMAEIQINRKYDCTKKEYEGSFDISEILVWGRTGIDLMNRLVSEWDEIKRKYNE